MTGLISLNGTAKLSLFSLSHATNRLIMSSAEMAGKMTTCNVNTPKTSNLQKVPAVCTAIYNIHNCHNKNTIRKFKKFLNLRKRFISRKQLTCNQTSVQLSSEMAQKSHHSPSYCSDGRLVALQDHKLTSRSAF